MADGTLLADRHDLWQTEAVDALLRGAPDGLAVTPAARTAHGGLLARSDTLAAARALHDHAARARAPLAAIVFDLYCVERLVLADSRAAADAALRHIGALVSMNIQPGVDLAGLLERSKLLLMLPEADTAWAQSFAERLAGTLANRQFDISGVLTPLAVNYGVAARHADEQDVTAMINRARSMALRPVSSAA